jgi:hypothetical protein
MVNNPFCLQLGFPARIYLFTFFNPRGWIYCPGPSDLDDGLILHEQLLYPDKDIL